MNEDIYQISMPAQVKTRIELINGVGIQELVYTVLGGVLGAFVGVVYNTIAHNFLFAFVIFGIITAITFICTMKDKYNNSIAILIINIYKYFQNQKFFKYVKREEK